MKKTIAVMIAAGLIGGALAAAPAEAKKRKKVVRTERTEEFAYTGGNLGVLVAGNGGGACLNGAPAFTCMEVPTAATEMYIKVEVVDASGQKVTGFIAQGDKDGDGISDGFGTFCGAHPMPIPIEPSVPVTVSIYRGACEDGSPSIVTTGTVKVTLSNLP